MTNHEARPAEAPRLVRRIRGNWLTRRPDPDAFFVATLATLLLALASLLYWSDFGQASEWMAAIPGKVFRGRELWRPWTALLAHADLGHLLANCVLFFAFAYLLYGHFGPVAFPIAPFLIGGVTNLVVLASLPPAAELIGVSGVVYWMGGAWLTLFLCLESRDRRGHRLLKALGVGVALFVPETIRTEVSYLSHFVGFVLGVAWASAYYRLNRARFRRAEVVEVRVEEPAPFDYEDYE